ncbi:potassium transporter, putative [Babesia ovis]|uniref:Potassium transporter, putative n=1 Tax=Babesia ovis TaxID=5869 RepID=A0A9W5T9C9_BABOV|nr:potassium transporter, putative [Babesia ovis]GFE53255.1 potassium transporter, putative [Babesia ovis]GFE53256.1 potassium transporter, putative [Babesia ovis]
MTGLPIAKFLVLLCSLCIEAIAAGVRKKSVDNVQKKGGHVIFGKFYTNMQIAFVVLLVLSILTLIVVGAIATQEAKYYAPVAVLLILLTSGTLFCAYKLGYLDRLLKSKAVETATEAVEEAAESATPQS